MFKSNAVNCFKNYCETIKKANDMLEKVLEVGSNGPLDFYLNKINEYINVLFDRFAPFKVGDRVELIKTPIINEKESWGWLSSKHFLVKGALATVKDVDYEDGKFIVDVIFDEESWIDDKGKKRKIENKDKHTYCISEKSIRRVK